MDDRNIVDLEEAENVDFSVFEKDISERHARIPHLKELYLQKLALLSAFRTGRNIWNEDRRYSKAGI